MRMGLDNLVNMYRNRLKVILDVGHNESGIKRALEYVRSSYE
jgi:folylpolyglutamate synthase/dihydropteroate synthase